jgi:hypothetical protein
MSQPRFRKVHREIATLARRLGVQNVRLEARGKHIRLVGQRGDVEVSQIFSSSPSDWRTIRNIEALLKRSIGR